jgi:hypothetical protein
MDFRQILRVLKYELPGHKFNGNQWLDENGNFRGGAGGNGGGRAVRVVQPAIPRVGRAPRPTAGRAPKPAPVVAKPSVPLKVSGKAVGLNTAEINKPLGGVMRMGGAMNKGFQKVEMKDGSVGAIKNFKAPFGTPFTATRQAQNEILASRVGAALGMPIRCCEGVAGNKDQIVQPWLEGKPAAEVDRVVFSGNNPNALAALHPDNATRLNQLEFFHQLIGNADGVFRIGNNRTMNPGNVWVQKDGSILGIDHALAFDTRSHVGMPDFSLLGNPSREDIIGMSNTLSGLKDTFTAMGRADSYNEMMQSFSAGAVTYGQSHGMSF